MAAREDAWRLAGRPESDLPAPRLGLGDPSSHRAVSPLPSSVRPRLAAMSLHLFAGLRVRDFQAARPWYERLLGEPTFLPHPTATTTTPSFSPPTRWCSAG